MKDNQIIEKKILEDFNILKEKIYNKKNIYLDNAATTQKPSSVIASISDYYNKTNANPHRGAHYLSVEATKIYEDTREKVALFINSKSSSQVIFTKNATESLNLIAYAYGLNNLKKDDEIVICITEHHSNLVPWQMVAKKTGAILKYMYVEEDGILLKEEIDKKITKKTKMVSIAQMTNTLGMIYDIEYIAKKTHEVGAVISVDASQSIPHMKVDVSKLDVDFLSFSGHKMLAPMGVGVLYVKEEMLNKMTPFIYGGDMIEYVEEQLTTYAESPFKFEAGTQNVEAVYGLNKAIDYILDIGYEYIEENDKKLSAYAKKLLREIPYVTVYGPKENDKTSSIVLFNIQDVHPHDVATILDKEGVAIRAGHHCAQPFMKYLGVNATCRASIYLYNTKEDIEKFIEAVKKVRGWLKLGT